VALDIAITMAMGIIAVYAIQHHQPVFLDVALILALLSFLGTVAFAYYIERRV
jgi:multicomponent Na+:H+ antiporter subunit F